MSLNLFRLAGDMSHVISIAVLLFRLHVMKTAQGISVRTHELFLLVFATRYLDLFTSFYSLYNSTLKIIYLLSTASIIYTIRFQEPIKNTYDIGRDTFPRWKLAAVPCALLALVTASDSDDVMEVFWAFSIYLEALAILPQLIVLQRSREADNMTLVYVFFMGLYRGLYIVNWIYRAHTERNYRHNWNVYLCAIIQTLLYVDFFSRFKFVYDYERGVWRVVQYHSRILPQEKEHLLKASEDDILSLLSKWNDALLTLDCVPTTQANAQVTNKNPSELIVGTSLEAASTSDVEFQHLNAQHNIVDSFISIGDSWSVQGNLAWARGSKVEAYSTFVYYVEDDERRISRAHSSAIAKCAGSEKVTRAEVQANCHHDGLASCISINVARHYAKNAEMLPGTLDSPQGDCDSLKEYFAYFLPKKPHVAILESSLSINEIICKEVGTYELALPIDGSKRKGHFSFVYDFEDGDWMISHYHASTISDSILSSITKEELADILCLESSSLPTCSVIT